MARKKTEKTEKTEFKFPDAQTRREQLEPLLRKVAEIEKARQEAMEQVSQSLKTLHPEDPAIPRILERKKELQTPTLFVPEVSLRRICELCHDKKAWDAFVKEMQDPAKAREKKALGLYQLTS